MRQHRALKRQQAETRNAVYRRRQLEAQLAANPLHGTRKPRNWRKYDQQTNPDLAEAHCAKCDKRIYRDRSRAKEAIRSLNGAKACAPTTAPQVKPGGWHIGHLNPRRREGR